MQHKLIISLLFLLFTLFSGFAFADTTQRGVTLNSSITSSDITTLKDWKVNLVRFAIRVESADSDSVANYNLGLAAQLTKLDTLLPFFEQAGIKVVVLIDTPPGGFQQKNPIVRHRLFVEQEFKDAFLNTWSTIANRYKDSSVVDSYILLNEPREISSQSFIVDWDSLALETATLVRSLDTNHRIYVEPSDFKKINKITKFLTISNTGYSIHSYFYWQFVHQGLFRKLGQLYPTKTIDKKKLKSFFRKIVKQQKLSNVPVLVSEFTVARWAPKSSALRYLKDLVNEFEKQGWNWTYHAFREADVWSLEHSDKKSVNTPVTSETGRLKLMKKFWSKNHV